MDYLLLSQARKEDLKDRLGRSLRSACFRSAGELIALLIGGTSLWVLVFALSSTFAQVPWRAVLASVVTCLAGYASRSQVLASRSVLRSLDHAQIALGDSSAELRELKLNIDRQIEVSSRGLARAGWLIGTSSQEWLFLEDAFSNPIPIKSVGGPQGFLTVSLLRKDSCDYVFSAEGLLRGREVDFLIYDSEEPLEKRRYRQQCCLPRLASVSAGEISSLLESVNAHNHDHESVKVAAGSACRLRALLTKR